MSTTDQTADGDEVRDDQPDDQADCPFRTRATAAAAEDVGDAARSLSEVLMDIRQRMSGGETPTETQLDELVAALDEVDDAVEDIVELWQLDPDRETSEEIRRHPHPNPVEVLAGDADRLAVDGGRRDEEADDGE